MSTSAARTGLRLAFVAALSAGVCACDSRPVIVDGMLEWEDAGTPSSAGEAARRVIGSKNPDWQRKGVTYLADEDFGGEPYYRALYRGELPYKGGFVDSEKVLGEKMGIKSADAGVRAASARALGEHGGAEDGAAIVPLLSDKEPMVRLAAADALRKIELAGEAKDKAQEGLVKLLADEDVDVRAKAADALGHFPSERTMRALLDALEDPSFTVVWYAHRSLVAAAGKDDKGAAVDFGYDSRPWGQWLGGRKNGDQGEAACAYLWQPYYRRPSAVQWGWQPWTWMYDAPPGEAPRAKAQREESSLKQREAEKAKDEKRMKDFAY